MVGGTADPGLRPGTLAGRQAECGVIARALERLADGRSQVVELTGDPGIGKSRLLAELARQSKAPADLLRRLPTGPESLGPAPEFLWTKGP